MLKWETACRFSTCVVRSFLYIDTDFVDILFLVPQCYLFRRRTFFACFKSLIKISKEMKLPKLFQKDRFKHELLSLCLNRPFYLKSRNYTELKLQHQLQKWLLVSANSMYLTERLLISLNPQKLFLARSNTKSHNFFICVVMFNLTILWVRENSIFLFRTQKSC